MKQYSYEEILKTVQKLKQSGKTTVLVHGVFDILHVGHISLLTEAKKLGDILIVGVDHDVNVKKMKGKKRPINNHEDRAFLLSYLKPVDSVFVIPPFIDVSNAYEFYKDMYEKLRPDVIATSIKAGRYGVIKRSQAKEVGIKFVDISDYIHDKNTTKIIELLKK